MARSKNRFEEILAEYARKYDIDSIDSPNDQANLRTFINLQIAIEQLQEEAQKLIQGGIVANLDDLERVNDTLKKLVDTGVVLERALGLDRKSRASDKVDNVADYIANLKTMAQDFLEKQYIRAECPNCQILVGRVIPALEHTAFECHFQCSQCGKKITIKRGEKDPFFDFSVSERAWRKQHKYEVIQAKKADIPTIKSDAQLIIEDDTADVIADQLEEDLDATTEEN